MFAKQIFDIKFYAKIRTMVKELKPRKWSTKRIKIPNKLIPPIITYINILKNKKILRQFET